MSAVVFRVFAPNYVHSVIPNMSLFIDLMFVVLNQRHHGADMEGDFIKRIGIVIVVGPLLKCF